MLKGFILSTLLPLGNEVKNDAASKAGCKDEVRLVLENWTHSQIPVLMLHSLAYRSHIEAAPISEIYLDA